MTDIIINKKFTAEEKETILFTIRLKALLGTDDAPTTQEDFDEWCDKIIAEKKAEEQRKAEQEAKRLQRKAEAEQRKAQRELEEATALNLTIEEYKEYQKYNKNIQKHKVENYRILNTIAKLQKDFERHEKKIRDWEDKRDKLLNR